MSTLPKCSMITTEISTMNPLEHQPTRVRWQDSSMNHASLTSQITTRLKNATPSLSWTLASTTWTMRQTMITARIWPIKKEQGESRTSTHLHHSHCTMDSTQRSKRLMPLPMRDRTSSTHARTICHPLRRTRCASRCYIRSWHQ